MKFLDTATIKFKFKGVDENPLAITTLNLNNEIEIRYAPILWKHDRSGLFFTMPSLRNFRFQSCVIVLDKDEYKKLQDRIFQEFLVQAKEYYHPNEFLQIETAFFSEKALGMNIGDIPL